MEYIENKQELVNIRIEKVQCKGDTPRKRGNFSSAIQGKDTIYIIGGNSNEQEYSDFYSLNLKTFAWKSIPYNIAKSLTGHKSVFLSSGIDIKTGILTYGGWNGEDYNDSIFLTDLGDMTAKESLRYAEDSEKKLRSHKTMGDVRQKIEHDLNIPDGRRDFTMNFINCWDSVVITGGWNALEWNPQQVELDIWFLISGKFTTMCGRRADFFRMEMVENPLGC